MARLPRISSVEARISSIAGRQHGVIAVAQLLAAGLSHDAIERRVKSGRLHRLRRGVHAVGYAALPYEGQAIAAACSAPPPRA